MQLQPGLPYGASVAAVPLLDFAHMAALLGEDGVDLDFVHERSLSVMRPGIGPRGTRGWVDEPEAQPEVVDGGSEEHDAPRRSAGLTSEGPTRQGRRPITRRRRRRPRGDRRW